MNLAWRVMAALAFVNTVVLAVFVGVATLRYDAILSNLIRERLVVLTESIHAPFEAVAGLGVPLSTVRNAPAILARARESDDAIVAIQVLDDAGRVVHSTVRDAGRDRRNGAAAGDPADDPSARGRAETESAFVVGAPILSPSGESVGEVLIEYSKDAAVLQVRAMGAKLGLAAIGVLALTLVSGIVMMRFALAEHSRGFAAILDAYDHFERSFWRGASSRDADAAEVDAMGVRTSEFLELLERSEERYERERNLRAAGPDARA